LVETVSSPFGKGREGEKGRRGEGEKGRRGKGRGEKGEDPHHGILTPHSFSWEGFIVAPFSSCFKNLAQWHQSEVDTILFLLSLGESTAVST